MTLLVVALLFLTGIILALYVVGVFATPYLEAFRFGFYLVLVVLAVTVGFMLMTEQQYGGYDPIVRVP